MDPLKGCFAQGFHGADANSEVSGDLCAVEFAGHSRQFQFSVQGLVTDTKQGACISSSGEPNVVPGNTVSQMPHNFNQKTSSNSLEGRVHSPVEKNRPLRKNKITGNKSNFLILK